MKFEKFVEPSFVTQELKLINNLKVYTIENIVEIVKSWRSSVLKLLSVELPIEAKY